MKALVTGDLNTGNGVFYVMSIEKKQKRTAWNKGIIKNHPFSLDNFDDGYVDNKGRFRVRMPNHPRAYSGGYILRSIVAYEAYHNVMVPKGMNIHHIDENRTNDSKENLVLMTHKQHSLMTIKQKRPKKVENRICENCGVTFVISLSRLNDTSGGSIQRGRFCSQACYNKQKRSESHKKNISIGLKRAYREGRR